MPSSYDTVATAPIRKIGWQSEENEHVYTCMTSCDNLKAHLYIRFNEEFQLMLCIFVSKSLLREKKE